MKILHISEVFMGGVGSYIQEVCRVQVAEFGAENIRVLGPASALFHIPTLPDACLHGVEMGSRAAGAVLQLMRAARAEIRDYGPDIVHVHSSFAGLAVRLPYVPRTLIGKTSQRRFRLLYCPHGWSFDMTSSARSKSAFYALIERCLAPTADAILCVSENERTSALKHGLSDNRLHVIRNSVATPSIDPTLALPTIPNRLNLLFVGRFGAQKGIDLLAQAARCLPADRIHLHVIGGPLEETIEGRTASGLAGQQHVTLHGWVPRPVVLATIAACDAVVMPSRWEGMPMVAAEAMALGRPLLASDIGPLAEIVKDGESGQLYASNDAEALAACLSTVTAEILARQGAAARKAFAKLFSVQDMTNGLIQLYERLRCEA